MKKVLIARPLWPVLRRVAPILSAAGYLVEEAPAWEKLLEAHLSNGAELAGVILGEHGHVEGEVAVLRRFREWPGSIGIPVMVVGGRHALLRAERFREAGADLVLSAGIDPEALAETARPLLRYGAMCQSLVESNRELRELSLRDELTGLPNRRHFSLDLIRNMEMVRRIGRPLSCIIVDIDDFKNVNDAYGHPAGDNVIRQFGTALDRGKRTYDSVARLGGDEFAWLLVNADREEALQAAARAHRLVAETGFEPALASPIRVTATFGVSTVSPGVDISGDDLVGNADRALYWGKESGKNVVRFYPHKVLERNAATDSRLS